MLDGTYQTVVTAALLHDIGKFLHRRYGRLPSHPAVSKQFVADHQEILKDHCDIELLKELVARHHENEQQMGKDYVVKYAFESAKPYAWLVDLADNYSSAERGEEKGKGGPKSTPMVSIFTTLNRDGKEPKDIYKYRPHRLDLDDNCDIIFPIKNLAISSTDYNDPVDDFDKTFRSTYNFDNHGRFDSFLAWLDHILYRYTWAVASNTQERYPDISLYDHLRTSAAIAICMYKYHEPSFEIKALRRDTDERFLLLMGDFGGVQDYIFGIQTIDVGSIAKRFRARSAFVNVLTDILAYRIINVLGLPFLNIISSAAGKFFILAPNTADACGRLREFRSEINERLLQEFAGNLSFYLEWQKLCGRDFEDYGSVLTGLQRKMSLAKMKSRIDYFHDKGEWNQDFVLTNHRFTEKNKMCKCCGKLGIRPDGTPDSESFCKYCNYDRKMGGILPRAKFLHYYSRPAEDRDEFDALGWSFEFSSEFRQKDQHMSFSIAGQDIKESHNHPVRTKFIASYIPTFDKDYCDQCRHRDECREKEQFKDFGLSANRNQPRFFSCLAYQAKGAPYLGYLKADVDNLGRLFSYGFENKRRSISRLSTFSRMLDLFFCGWFDRYVREKYTDLYTVFSGGDDLMIVGPWDRIADFALDFRSRFNSFVCGRKDITLSAGIALAKAHQPVASAVGHAQRNLRIAKESGGDLKDSICFLGKDSLKWDKQKAVVNNAMQISEYLGQGDGFSVAFLYRLQTYIDNYKLWKGTNDAFYLQFVPMFAYDIARNLKKKSKARMWAEKVINNFNIYMPRLEPAIHYALLLKRGEKDEK
jgi:CRISPR-associated protein Csm1